MKEEDLLREYDKLVVSALSRCANVRLDANSQLLSLLPSSSGGLGLTSAFHLALPAFLASAVGCGSLTQTILSKFDIGDDTDITLAFTSWSSKTGLQNVLSQRELQKSWTAPIYKMLSSELLDSLDDIGKKRFLCFQGKLPAAWLNALSCQLLGLKLTNSQLRISVGLRLGTPLCVEHVCVCGKSVDCSGWHGLSCSGSAGRFARHQGFQYNIKILSSISISSIQNQYQYQIG